LSPTRLARLRDVIQNEINADRMPGAVVLVARKGAIVHSEVVGFQDKGAGKPLKRDAIFRAYSMTKPMVALGILMLAEEGKLSIADPVEKHLPEFRSLADKITLQQLMTHTAGMPLNPPPGIGELHGALHKPLADVALVYSQTPVGFRPGSKWQYSNAGIAVLARVIEVHSGLRFEEFLAKRVFEPLGMKDSSIFPPKEKWGRMPTAYILRDGVPVSRCQSPSCAKVSPS
jgi:CubicO group peptidase (beta-lactamase class C family)